MYFQNNGLMAFCLLFWIICITVSSISRGKGGSVIIYFIKIRKCFLYIITIFSFIPSLASISVKTLKVGSHFYMKLLSLDLDIYYIDRLLPS